MDYLPNEFYEVGGELTTGQVLNETQMWLNEYSNRIEKALAVMGHDRRVIGGRKYKDNQVRFDLNDGLGDRAEYARRVLNNAMLKHGKQCTISGKSIYVMNLTQRQRIDRIIGMDWVEANG